MNSSYTSDEYFRGAESRIRANYIQTHIYRTVERYVFDYVAEHIVVGAWCSPPVEGDGRCGHCILPRIHINNNYSMYLSGTACAGCTRLAISRMRNAQNHIARLVDTIRADALGCNLTIHQAITMNSYVQDVNNEISPWSRFLGMDGYECIDYTDFVRGATPQSSYHAYEHETTQQTYTRAASTPVGNRDWTPEMTRPAVNAYRLRVIREREDQRNNWRNQYEAQPVAQGGTSPLRKHSTMESIALNAAEEMQGNDCTGVYPDHFWSDDVSISPAATSDEITWPMRLEEFIENFKDAVEVMQVDYDLKPPLRVLENVGFFVYDLSRSKDWKEYVFSAYRLVTNTTNISLLSLTGSWLHEIYIAARDAPVRFQAGVTNPTEGDSILGSEAFAKFKKLVFASISYAMSYLVGKTLEREVFKSIWKKYAKDKFSDWYTSISDFIQWLVKVVPQIWAGEKGLDVVLREKDAVEEFDIDVAKILHHSTLLKDADESEMTYGEFSVKMKELQTMCEFLIKETNQPQVKRTLGAIHLKLATALKAVTDVYNKEILRRKPFSLLFEGPTGVGKSSLNGIVIPQLQKAMRLPCGARYVYNYDETSKYMDALKAEHNTYCLDDLAQSAPAYAEKQAAAIVIQVINNHKSYAVMPDLSDKGRLVIRPDIVVASTNGKHMHAGTTTMCKSAVFRRFEYTINVTVRNECSQGGMLKTSNHNPEDCHHQCWLFEVTTAQLKPGDASDVIYVPEVIEGETKVPLDAMMRFLVQKSKEHKARQTNLVKDMLEMPNRPLCQHEIFQSMCSKCNFGVAQRSPRIPLHLTMGFQGGTMSTSREKKLEEEAKQGKWFNYLVAYKVFWANRFPLWQRSTVFLTGLLTPLAMRVGMMNPIFVFPCAALSMSGMYFTTSAFRIRRLAGEPVQSLSSVIKVLHNNWRKNRKDLILLGLLATAVTSICMWRKSIQAQGARMSLAIPDGVTKIDDPYRVPHVEPVPRNVDTASMTSEQAIGLLKNSMYIARFSNDGIKSEKWSNTFPMESHLWVINTHLSGYQYMTIMKAGSDKTNVYRKIVLKDNFVQIPNSDVTIVYAPEAGDNKDITKLLPTEKQLIGIQKAGCLQATGKLYESETPHGTRYVDVVKDISRINASYGSFRMEGAQGTIIGGHYQSMKPTYDGMCGSPIITDRTGPLLVGIHCGGVPMMRDARYTSFTKEQYDQAKKKLINDSTFRLQGAELTDFTKALDFPGTNFVYKHNVRPGCTSSFVEGEYTYYGSNTCPQRTFRSKVIKSIISDDVCTLFGVERDHGAPKYINHWSVPNRWMNAMSANASVPVAPLQWAFLDYTNKIFEFWDKHPELEFGKRIVQIDNDMVLSGLDGVKGIYPMNWGSSMGIPWCKPKRDFFPISDREVDGISAPRDMPPGFLDELEKQMELMRNMQRVYYPHRCNVKDEPKKLIKDKVRTFMGTQIYYQFLMRKFLLAVSALMQCHPELFESAVGVNAYGSGWGRLHDYIFKYSKTRCIDGDYGGYDTSPAVAIVLAAWKVIYLMCKKADWDEDSLNIVIVLAIETAKAVYELRGEWLSFVKGLPSGHPFTVIINGIVNCILMRMAFYVIFHEHEIGKPPKFHDCVSLMTYGDDNAMSVHGSCPWFTHRNIVKVFASWNITYTAADKGTEGLDYKPAEKISFLKRTFVWDEELSRMLAPLEKSSIFKSLTNQLVSSVISKEAQCAQIIDSANREFVMYGKSEFEKAHEMLNAILDKHQLRHHLPQCRLLSFDELQDWVTNKCE